MIEWIESENAEKTQANDALGWLIIAARSYNGYYHPADGSPSADPEYQQAYTSAKYPAEWAVIGEAWHSFTNKLIPVEWADYYEDPYETDWGDIGLDPMHDYADSYPDPDNTEHEDQSDMDLMYPNPEDLEYETDYFGPEY